MNERLTSFCLFVDLSVVIWQKHLSHFSWKSDLLHNEIYKITKTEMGSPCNENGEYKNYQKYNKMDAI